MSSGRRELDPDARVLIHASPHEYPAHFLPAPRARNFPPTRHTAVTFRGANDGASNA